MSITCKRSALTKKCFYVSLEINMKNFESEENTQEFQQLESKLIRAQTELNLLYEISNAMRTTLKLEQILYIILTATTAHAGLGFNRAMLFLVNEKEGLIEGKMGIGPDTGEQANDIWKNIDTKRMDLYDLINVFNEQHSIFYSKFNNLVKNLRLPIKEESGLLAITLLEGMPLHINKEKTKTIEDNLLLNVLKLEEFVIVPLKAHDKVIGLILADNVYNKKPITNDDLRILSMFANQAGLAIENSRLYEKTLIQSHKDSLTNLWNHAYFQFLLKNELKNAQVDKNNLSIIMLDIDNFKEHNDKHGHQSGDQILYNVAKIIKDSARRKDHACRYGGEEFAVILPNTKLNEANNIAERIRKNIASNLFDNQITGEIDKITVSLGVATYPEDADSPSKLISICDKKMYKAKTAGKNKVVFN